MIGFWLIAALLVVINLAVMPYFLFLLATALAALLLAGRNACPQTRARGSSSSSRLTTSNRASPPRCLAVWRRTIRPCSSEFWSSRIIARTRRRQWLARRVPGSSSGSTLTRKAKVTRSNICWRYSSDRESCGRSTPSSSSTLTQRSIPTCCARLTMPCAEDTTGFRPTTWWRTPVSPGVPV